MGGVVLACKLINEHPGVTLGLDSYLGFSLSTRVAVVGSLNYDITIWVPQRPEQMRLFMGPTAMRTPEVKGPTRQWQQHDSMPK